MPNLKSIKVEEDVYRKLDDFRGKHETFSQAVDRLLTIKDGVGIMVDVLEGNKKFREFMESKRRKSSPAADVIENEMYGITHGKVDKAPPVNT